MFIFSEKPYSTTFGVLSYFVVFAGVFKKEETETRFTFTFT